MMNAAVAQMQMAMTPCPGCLRPTPSAALAPMRGRTPSAMPALRSATATTGPRGGAVRALLPAPELLNGAGAPDLGSITALADAAKQRMKNFNSQALANTLWAFATVGRKDEQLFTAWADAAKQHT